MAKDADALGWDETAQCLRDMADDATGWVTIIHPNSGERLAHMREGILTVSVLDGSINVGTGTVTFSVQREHFQQGMLVAVEGQNYDTLVIELTNGMVVDVMVWKKPS